MLTDTWIKVSAFMGLFEGQTPAACLQVQAGCVLEEALEAAAEAEAVARGEPAAVALLQESADVFYALVGALVTAGWGPEDFARALAEVAAANAAKGPPAAVGGKATKPPGWRPAAVEGTPQPHPWRPAWAVKPYGEEPATCGPASDAGGIPAPATVRVGPWSWGLVCAAYPDAPLLTYPEARRAHRAAIEITAEPDGAAARTWRRLVDALLLARGVVVVGGEGPDVRGLGADTVGDDGRARVGRSCFAP